MVLRVSAGFQCFDISLLRVGVGVRDDIRLLELRRLASDGAVAVGGRASDSVQGVHT